MVSVQTAVAFVQTAVLIVQTTVLSEVLIGWRRGFGWGGDRFWLRRMIFLSENIPN